MFEESAKMLQQLKKAVPEISKKAFINSYGEVSLYKDIDPKQLEKIKALPFVEEVERGITEFKVFFVA